MIVTEAKCSGDLLVNKEFYQGQEHLVEYVPRLQVTVFAADEDCGLAVDAILECFINNKPGEGIIFVKTIDNFICISTKERGESVLKQ